MFWLAEMVPMVTYLPPPPTTSLFPGNLINLILKKYLGVKNGTGGIDRLKWYWHQVVIAKY